MTAPTPRAAMAHNFTISGARVRVPVPADIQVQDNAYRNHARVEIQDIKFRETLKFHFKFVFVVTPRVPLLISGQLQVSGTCW